MTEILAIPAITRPSDRFRCPVLPGTPVLPASACIARQHRANLPDTIGGEKMRLQSCADCALGRQVRACAKKAGAPRATMLPAAPKRRSHGIPQFGRGETQASIAAAEQRVMAGALNADLAERMGIAPTEPAPSVSNPQRPRAQTPAAQPEITMDKPARPKDCRRCGKRPEQPLRGKNPKRPEMAGLCKQCKISAYASGPTKPAKSKAPPRAGDTIAGCPARCGHVDRYRASRHRRGAAPGRDRSLRGAGGTDRSAVT
jgi:hypothetical protein